ncbi:MAG: glycine cleavage system protein T [Sneathiella sp.]|mgnify:CR=1 FL=1|jgi:folate-binding protein YgfZ|uniref:CAF17-like 4Fe-4S cluster assembly/insertion protein YgfZ n=1 Tax=Sneathiella sp. TaxID=1964365 RepID=UPI000C453D18|nr:hypothetical protein [Sneathiella sp.]MAL77591.1 glycine cleavage system protein T [Sneathiella sp.]
MAKLTVTKLDNRRILALAGKDVWTFLQNLITNDMKGVSETHGLYSALLTAQGKFLHDFFIVKSGDAYLLDVARDRAEDLIRRLTLYKLRADVTISPTDQAVFALFGADAIATAGLAEKPGAAVDQAGSILYVDPRQQSLGVRIIAAADFNPASLFPDATKSDAAAYDAHRLKLAIPDGGRDILPEKNFLLEANFEELNGVSFAKGCYVGQELTARTKYRGTIKKRLLRIEFDGELTDGDKITLEGREIGEVRSFANGQGLALVRLDGMAGEPAALEPAGIRIVEPDYITPAIAE